MRTFHASRSKEALLEHVVYKVRRGIVGLSLPRSSAVRTPHRRC